MLRVVRSTSAAARLDAAAQFLETRPPFSEVVVVGASRGAADDLARRVAQRLGATFGILRFSLTELAARAAGQVLEARRIPGTQAANEAMAARATFDATAAGELAYFAPVAKMPGFPKALARTIHELRLAGCPETSDATGSGIRLLNERSHPAVGDLECLLTHVETERARSGIDDRAALFDGASRAWRSGRVTWAGLPLVLLDVTIDSRAEQEFVQALIERASAALATIPDGDLRARAAFERMGASIDVAPDAAQTATDLAHLRKYVFTNERPPLRERSGDVTLFSAPGEGREALEIVRRILDEAQSGVRFDEMAVFLRTPQQYLGLLEHAAARGGVPVYFDRGTRRPDPAGRAFVALLSCGVDGLSAKRFDEYLSLGQVPRLDPSTALGTGFESIRPCRRHATKSLSDRTLDTSDVDDPETAVPAPPLADSDEDAIVAGTLRSPWKWEELIVESSVVGGRTREDGKLRWRRRLDGLAAEYRLQIAELAREEPESARIRRFERDLANLTHLRRFALPIVDTLADWPEHATWGEWISRFSGWHARRCRARTVCLRTLADLRPDERRGTGVARRGARRSARSARDARLGSARAPIRSGVRGHAASSPRTIVPGRVRARSRRARGPTTSARRSAAARRSPSRYRRRSVAAGRSQRRRAAAAQNRDWRGVGTTVSLVSADGRGGNKGACAVVLRARRDARDHRSRARSSRPCRRCGRRSRREPRVAGAEGSGPGDRRSGARPGRPQTAARFSRSGGGEGARALSARFE